MISGGKFLRAYWQLAHECVHVLSRTETQQATVLEEGVACHFQVEYMRKRFQWSWPPETWGHHAYRSAYLMTRSLLDTDPYAIQRMRQAEPTISLIGTALIRRECPSISEKLAQVLSTPFYRGSPLLEQVVMEELVGQHRRP